MILRPTLSVVADDRHGAVERHGEDDDDAAREVPNVRPLAWPRHEADEVEEVR